MIGKALDSMWSEDKVHTWSKWPAALDAESRRGYKSGQTVLNGAWTLRHEGKF